MGIPVISVAALSRNGFSASLATTPGLSTQTSHQSLLLIIL
ncbi:hypothetical protein AEST_17310 [Alishewanella aestuarii B11]|uniref:Uncharacterized protein n=1 Tax=Alishewanella aestuarii B11 TaxID=1197174 RepID=J2IE20_9ALTE|nr:hypothetical protein AEST_17310 [Alishewanella aestuarii B11]